MKKKICSIKSRWLALLAFFLIASPGHAQSPSNVHQATLRDTEQKTQEVSTEELRGILAERSAVVFDVRPSKEYAVSHIPGAVNVSGRPGVSISLYVSDVAEIGRVLKGNRSRPVVIYCNGPFCGKSKRLAAELLEAGYTNVRRYQLGIPVWRALGGVTQIEPEGVQHVFDNDRTAAFIDAREIGEFKAGSIPSARNLPRSGLRPGKDAGEVKAAKDDWRLPMDDHNTRVIVFGQTGEQAQAVAEAIAKEAFHNVSYFDGSFEQFKAALKP
ncbi:MAG: rhodanese-like domain-containing protein [Acidobacteriota bacterium]